MPSECAHGRSDHQLCRIVSNKKICIIGPSAHLFNENLGAQIEAYDIICRVHHLPNTSSAHDLGSRTDIYFTSFSSEWFASWSQGKAVQNADLPEIFVGPRLAFDCLPLDFRLTTKTSIQKLITKNNFNYPYELVDQNLALKNYLNLGGYPTTGSLSIMSILAHSPKSLYVCGMTWYESGALYYDGSPSKNGQVPGHDMAVEVKKLRKVLSKCLVEIDGDKQFKRIMQLKNYRVITDWNVVALRLTFAWRLHFLSALSRIKTPK